jgi:hypothetical protein
MLVGAAVAGCVDARDEYDDYGDRLIDADPGSIDGEPSDIPDVTGEFYMVALPANLGEERFIHFHCTFAVRGNRLDWTGQPLDYETREPVGVAFVATDVAVAADASVRLPMVGTLHARANSISGSNAPVNATVVAHLRSADFVCGELTGTAGALTLDGTTFGGVRITGAALPDQVVRCEDEPAAR